MPQNNKQIDTVKLKEIQLDILKEFSDFCEKNNLRYSLAYGTLIGAVRHKGYIPWDDDIDVIMPRPDFEKFFNQFNHPYIKQFRFTNKKGFSHTFMKLSNEKTVLKEMSTMEAEIGVNIDIFPLDGTNTKLSGKLQMITATFLRKLLMVKQISNMKQRSLHKTIILCCLKFALVFIPQKFIVYIIDKLSRVFDYEESKYVTYVAQFFLTKPYLKAKVFDSFVKLSFEDSTFYACAGYDEYLKFQYGDYMKLPPVEKQKSHHAFTAYFKD